MDFTLSKQHLLLRDMYRAFAENEVKPLAEEVDEEERFPMETVKKLARSVPEEVWRSGRRCARIRYGGRRAFQGLRDHGRYRLRAHFSLLRADL